MWATNWHGTIWSIWPSQGGTTQGTLWGRLWWAEGWECEQSIYSTAIRLIRCDTSSWIPSHWIPKHVDHSASAGGPSGFCCIPTAAATATQEKRSRWRWGKTAEHGRLTWTQGFLNIPKLGEDRGRQIHDGFKRAAECFGFYSMVARMEPIGSDLARQPRLFPAAWLGKLNYEEVK